MPGMLSGFKWGTGEENILICDFPFDNVRTYRKPRDGSSRVRIPGGGFDPWVNGRDYILEGDVRWLSFLKQSDPIGVQAFIDYAANGTFSFVPDMTVPDFAIPGCFLISPFEAPEPGSEESGDAIQRLVIGNPTFNLAQAMRGVMFEYAPGASLTDPVAAAFTRASAAYRTGVDKKDATEAANVLRDRHYYGGLRTALLEAARTPISIPDPENFSTANWTRVSCTVTHPYRSVGAINLDRVNDDQAGGFGRVESAAAFQFAAGGTNAWQVVARYESSVRAQIELIDMTTLARHGRVDIVFNADGSIASTTPAKGATSGNCTLLDIEPLEDGKTFRFWIQALNIVQANSYRIRCFATGESGGAAADLGATLFGAVQVENAIFPSSYTGGAARVADAFDWPFPYKPQAMFALIDYVSLGIEKGSDGNSFALQIGNAFQDGRVIIDAGSVDMTGFHQAQSSSVSQNVATGAARGDRVQALLLLNANGSVQLKRGYNLGAEVASGTSGALAFRSAWNPERIYFYGGTGSPFHGVARVKVATLQFAGITRDTIAKALAA